MQPLHSVADPDLDYLLTITGGGLAPSPRPATAMDHDSFGRNGMLLNYWRNHYFSIFFFFFCTSPFVTFDLFHINFIDFVKGKDKIDFSLQNLETGINSGLIGLLARMQTLPTYNFEHSQPSHPSIFHLSSSLPSLHEDMFLLRTAVSHPLSSS